MKTKFSSWLFGSAVMIASACSCGKSNGGSGKTTPPDTTTGTPATSQVAFWLTNPDKSALLKKQSTVLNFSAGTPVQPTITVDTTTTYQTMDGFGYTLTGGSAQLIYGLPAEQRHALENELFTTDSTYIGVSYLRLTMGASDMSARVFSSSSRPFTGHASATQSFWSSWSSASRSAPAVSAT